MSDIDPGLLAALAAFDTPTICNALEVVAPQRRGFGYTTRPLVPAFRDAKPFVGFARTARVRAAEPFTGDRAGAKAARFAYFDYVATGPQPTIMVIQDLDGARAGTGAYWGEVNSAIHKGLGCLGCVTDGSVRDLDLLAPGFKILAGMVGPSHAFIHLVDFGGEVSVAGMTCRTDDLVHADPHGAVVIPSEVAAEVPRACDLLARREAVILAAARDPGFTVAKLKQAIGEAEEIH